MSNDIHACLTEMAEGNMDALGELYQLLSVRIFNYARTITGSKEAAEDITHDVFLQIHKHAKRLGGMKNPLAYIMVAARNQSFDHIKRSKRAATSLEETPETGTESPCHDRLLIEDAFSRLPANQRETIYLHHVCGFTQKEVSQIMDVPLVTVKWRCKKALSGLQAYFIQNEEDGCNEIT